MIVNLIWFCGGLFLGLYLGNKEFRTKINDGANKILKKDKDKDTPKKGKKN